MGVGAWFETWTNVILRPGEVTMEDERAEPQATLGTAVVWVALVAVLSGFLNWIQGMIFMRSFQAAGGIMGVIDQLNLPPEQQQAITDALAQVPAGVPLIGNRSAPGVSILISTIISSIVGFLVAVMIYQLVAKILGGTGNFGKYAYLLAAIWVPLTVITALLGFIPLLGSCLTVIVGLYGVVLAYYATRVEHKLSSGRSIIVILTPVIVGLIALCCCGVTAGGILGGLMNSGR